MAVVLIGLLVVMAARSAGGAIPDEVEPPLSENDPMYFVVGTRGGTSARFQLSFKYRLFDASAGLGQEQPWLSGLYFGYTQNSLWDLSTESKAFRDTSYRPSLFWKWERTGQTRALFDGARMGLEHESNGGSGETSRSINIAFIRPEWIWRNREGASFEFTPKIYSYLDKEENTDIAQWPAGNLNYGARHSEQVNFLYLDGHVKSSRWDQLKFQNVFNAPQGHQWYNSSILTPR